VGAWITRGKEGKTLSALSPGLRDEEIEEQMKIFTEEVMPSEREHMRR
jgi:hypothetical protein